MSSESQPDMSAEINAPDRGIIPDEAGSLSVVQVDKTYPVTVDGGVPGQHDAVISDIRSNGVTDIEVLPEPNLTEELTVSRQQFPLTTRWAASEALHQRRAPKQPKDYDEVVDSGLAANSIFRGLSEIAVAFSMFVTSADIAFDSLPDFTTVVGMRQLKVALGNLAGSSILKDQATAARFAQLQELCATETVENRKPNRGRPRFKKPD